MATKIAARKPAKKAAKKFARKRPAHRTTAKRRAIQRLPSGYRVAPSGRILVPGGTVVEPSQLRKGITKAKDEINDLIQEVIDTSTTDYDIHEIEFAASFSADGKFMGIGVGGAATIKFRIRPC